MNNRTDPILYIVIPCYNEQEVLPITAPMFLQKLADLTAAGKISPESRVLFVNDGSKDRTWEIICDLAARDPHYAGICQSRNRGHQNAVLAGLMEAKSRCDITISIDCDGQDDINAMDAMVDAYRDGCDVVYGVRSKRETDTFFKRFTAESFYKILNAMGAEVVFNHADYRLMSARVLEEFARFREVNLFLRGMVPLVGFKSTCVTYERHERIAGESHYPLSKMLALAFDGITSLSIKPIRFITGFGVFVALVSFIGVLWAVIEAALGLTVSGWASMTSIICFVSGVQLICLGVIGEYIGKIYLESSTARGILSAMQRQTLARSRRMRNEPTGMEGVYPAEPGAARTGQLRGSGEAEPYHGGLDRHDLHPAADAVHQRAARAVQPPSNSGKRRVRREPAHREPCPRHRLVRCQERARRGQVRCHAPDRRPCGQGRHGVGGGKPRESGVQGHAGHSAGFA